MFVAKLAKNEDGDDDLTDDDEPEDDAEDEGISSDSDE